MILRRKLFERVIIRVPGRDRPIVVTLVDSFGDAARLGFDADPDVSVDREEIDRDKRSGNGSPRRPYA